MKQSFALIYLLQGYAGFWWLRGAFTLDPVNPRTMRPSWRVWEALATTCAATMAATYGGNIQTVLINPAGKQNTAPRRVAAPAMIWWFGPWSMWCDAEPSKGAATIRPIAHEADTHSRGDNLRLWISIIFWVKPAYLSKLIIHFYLSLKGKKGIATFSKNSFI